jgi:hypothetical protein
MQYGMKKQKEGSKNPRDGVDLATLQACNSSHNPIENQFDLLLHKSS